MRLKVDLRQRLGSFELQASFSSNGRLIAFFGASGSGKTTLVNLIAGLSRPDSGYITADGTALVDTGRGIFLPPYKRRIGYVFQDARLFPHLTVRQNLSYGRWFVPAAERYASFDDVVALLGIGDLLHRRPAALSGGEKQRVAIGRALMASPRLILMDEPLAALDDARKAEIMPYMARLRDEIRIPIIYVSHSVAEVSRLAEDVVLLAGGRVISAGPAAEVLGRHDLLPASELPEAGALLRLVVVGHEPQYCLTVLRSGDGEWRLPHIDAGIGAVVGARVRARDVMLATRAPEGLSALNVLRAKVVALEQTQDSAEALITLDCGGERLFARITRRSLDLLALQPGQAIFAVIKAVSVERGASIARWQSPAEASS